MGKVCVIRMIIEEIIATIKSCYKGENIDSKATRDKVLFGNTQTECTGIVTCIYASIDVIHQTIQNNYNFIICHEALFWNHGDKTDWLGNNQVYLDKKELLEKHGITVWRNHDYVHSGMLLNNEKYVDGIFYGFAKKLNLTSFMQSNNPLFYNNLDIKAIDLAKYIKNILNLNGIRIIGNPDTLVHRLWIPMHILGKKDDEKITKINDLNIDCVLALECVDFTVAEYIRDASMFKMNKCIIVLGHFNAEEPGMEYMAEYLNKYLFNIPIQFISCNDTYMYL